MHYYKLYSFNKKKYLALTSKKPYNNTLISSRIGACPHTGGGCSSTTNTNPEPNESCGGKSYD